LDWIKSARLRCDQSADEDVYSHKADGGEHKGLINQTTITENTSKSNIIEVGSDVDRTRLGTRGYTENIF
jgi:hypothetical protein